jgi:hypothetical protein
VLAKFVAGRERDWEFAHDALAAELVQAEELIRRAEDLPVSASERKRIREGLAGVVARLNRG